MKLLFGITLIFTLISLVACGQCNDTKGTTHEQDYTSKKITGTFKSIMVGKMNHTLTMINDSTVEITYRENDDDITLVYALENDDTYEWEERVAQ
ncbi:MAG: hypothetical protein OCC49_18140 [Fibrobacterales bacterium]